MAHQYPSFSPYVYVMNAPLQLIDPTGMAAENPSAIGRFIERIGNFSSGAGWRTNTELGDAAFEAKQRAKGSIVLAAPTVGDIDSYEQENGADLWGQGSQDYFDMPKAKNKEDGIDMGKFELLDPLGDWWHENVSVPLLEWLASRDKKPVSQDDQSKEIEPEEGTAFKVRHDQHGEVRHWVPRHDSESFHELLLDLSGVELESANNEPRKKQ